MWETYLVIRDCVRVELVCQGKRQHTVHLCLSVPILSLLICLHLPLLLGYEIEMGGTLAPRSTGHIDYLVLHSWTSLSAPYTQ